MKKKHSTTLPASCSTQRGQRAFTFVGNKFVAWSLIVISIAFMILGLLSSHSVYADKSLVDAGLLQISQEISEIELVEDATFSGVESYMGELCSTYDRSKPKTKEACPT